MSSYFLVPLSIWLGRRPVLLFAGAVAWAGGLWAGFSTSLESHLAARCFQGLGAGTVDRHASVNSGVSSVTDVTAVTGVSAMSSHHNYVSQARDLRGQDMEEVELRN